MRALGVILAGGKSRKLRELTQNRALAAMPVAGNFRAIDFSLSNMSNSGVGNVAVITQHNSGSIIKHLNSSKWWDFGRKQGGLHLFTPFISHDNSYWYRGTADSLYQNIGFFKSAHEAYVIITQGDSISKIDYNKVLDYHIGKDSDLTIVLSRVEDDNLSRFGHVTLDSDNRVVDFEEKPLEPQGNLVSTGTYIIRRRFLVEFLEKIINEGRYDFVTDIIVRYKKQLRIYGYLFDQYWTSIASIPAYYKCNMDFLDRDIRAAFLKEGAQLFTKIEDEPPAKFNAGAAMKNALCSSGCIMNGTVVNSVLFRRTFVGKESKIINSIVLNNCYIGDNCYLENCIIDSRCNISDGQVIVGQGKEPKIIVQNENSFY